MDELIRAADLFAVRELNGTDLTMVAAEALARGLDSPALVELACLHRTDCGDAPELFWLALAELGLIDAASWSEREVAVRLRRANHHAAALLNNEGDLDEHFAKIGAELFPLTDRLEPTVPDLVDLAEDFSTMSLCLDDGYTDPAGIRDDIRHGCRNLLAGPPYEPVYQRARPQTVAAPAPQPPPPAHPKRKAFARLTALFRR